MIRTSLLILSVLASCIATARSAGPAVVDTSTITGKVVCGYQGWFRCEGDGSNNGWHHYASGGKVEPGHIGIDVWPDMSELGPDERFATKFTFADGKPAELFSSVKAKTVHRHFEWMRDYGIDGAFVQRFATTTRDPRFRKPMDEILGHCRKAAGETGRGYVVMYDLTGLKAGQATVVKDDWKRLLAEKTIAIDGSDSAYFKHRGKPLVALWGLGFKENQTTLEEWADLLAFFKDSPEAGGCSVMVGVPYWWRRLDRDCLPDPRVHELIAKADIVSPWAVGRFGTPADAAKRGEEVLKPDLAWCAEKKVDYLPVLFPGFSWQNLSKGRGKEAKLNAIPRLEGKFLWSQAVAAKKAGAGMLYVAMFDEMDEATAIFKTTQQPPVGESQFLAEPAVKSDHYLWVTGEIGKLLRGQRGEELGGRN